jgi:hypothetical protein
LADSSDWPTLGSEVTTNVSSKKEVSIAASNGDLREKDNKKPAVTSTKPKSENTEGSTPADKMQDGEPLVNDSASKVKASSPLPDTSVSNEVKNVPKAVEDGAKRVNSKPKWNRFEGTYLFIICISNAHF